VSFAFGQGEIVILDAEATEGIAGRRVLDIELPRVLSIVAVEREGKAMMLADIDEIKLGITSSSPSTVVTRGSCPSSSQGSRRLTCES